MRAFQRTLGLAVGVALVLGTGAGVAACGGEAPAVDQAENPPTLSWDTGPVFRVLLTDELGDAWQIECNNPENCIESPLLVGDSPIGTTELDEHSGPLLKGTYELTLSALSVVGTEGPVSEPVTFEVK